MIVVDASVIIELLLQTQLADICSDRLFGQEEVLCAPHLIDIEVMQVLRRYTLKSEIVEERAEQALEDYYDFPIYRYPHDPFLRRVWALRHNLTAYDALYVALAEALEAVLVTCDVRIAEAPGVRAHIEVVG